MSVLRAMDPLGDHEFRDTPTNTILVRLYAVMFVIISLNNGYAYR